MVDEYGEIIAGHGRLEATRLVGMASIPTIVLPHLSAGQKKALRIADNKIALNAGWDLDVLRMEVLELVELDLSFDVGVIRFEPGEIDVLIDGAGEAAKADPADEVPSLMPKRCRRPAFCPTTRGEVLVLQVQHDRSVFKLSVAHTLC